MLKNVNLNYVSGSINGIIGSNGAGKSTLFNCIAGNISYEGKILTNCASMGLLAAAPYMFPRVTGREFIHFCLSAKKRTLNVEKLNRLNALFALPLDKYATEYSTGMLKKLHLLALILQENDLFLLDEPFNGLDILSAAYLAELLKEIRKTSECVILVSSHDIAQLLKIADTITIVENQRAHQKTESLEDIRENIEKEAAERVKQLLV